MTSGRGGTGSQLLCPSAARRRATPRSCAHYLCSGLSLWTLGSTSSRQMRWMLYTTFKSLAELFSHVFGVLTVRPLSCLLLGLDIEAGQGGASLSCCGTHGETAVKQWTSWSVWTAAGPVLHAPSLQLSPLPTHTPPLNAHGTRASGGVEAPA